MKIQDTLLTERISSESQRIQVLTEASRVKICLERYDEQLGWYTAGSLVLPLEQLPMLQQTLQSLRTDTATSEQATNIIPLAPFLAAFPA